jgi:hypothetical protein
MLGKFIKVKLSNSPVPAFRACQVGILITLSVIPAFFGQASVNQSFAVGKPVQTFDLPAGWKEREIQHQVTIGLPENMKPAKLVGDSNAYQEAWNNRQIYLVIGLWSNESEPRKKWRRLCGYVTPEYLLRQSTYKERLITVAGRKAKLSIDRHLVSEYIIAMLCVPPDDKGTQLVVEAYSKGEPALRKALQIFETVRFKEPIGEWKILDVKNKVTIRVPPDMQPSELIGDSFAYREAYRNRNIEITIAYDARHPPVRPDQTGDLFDPCETQKSLREEPTYDESVVDIDGRKAKLRIDRYHKPKFILANVCFLNPPDPSEQLIVLAHCKDEHALETAQQIFNSIRFKDSK